MSGKKGHASNSTGKSNISIDLETIAQNTSSEVLEGLNLVTKELVTLENNPDAMTATDVVEDDKLKTSQRQALNNAGEAKKQPDASFTNVQPELLSEPIVTQLTNQSRLKVSSPSEWNLQHLAFQVNVEVLLYSLMIVAGVATRFYDLGNYQMT